MHILRLLPTHADAYRALMLQAYATEPDAFTATVPERAAQSLAWWKARVADQPDAPECVFGAFVGDQLVGVAGLRFEQRERTKHKATLFGMFVLPPFRGQGIARALIKAVLHRTEEVPGTRVVQLKVTETNMHARRLYEACGFQTFGIEPMALSRGERFASVVYMWREVA